MSLFKWLNWSLQFSYFFKNRTCVFLINKTLVNQKHIVVILPPTTNVQEKMVENEAVTPDNRDEFVSTTDTKHQSQSKVYHPHIFLKYGGLAESVQRRSGRGTDGSLFADCTLT